MTNFHKTACITVSNCKWYTLSELPCWKYSSARSVCIVRSFVWVFAFQGRRTRRRIKSKCPSWRGEALGRPRCQGRMVFAFIGAERETLDRMSGRLGAGV